jgi:RNA polymerase sigma-70 factor (ECF subfamily)
MAFRILRDKARADEAMTEALTAIWLRCRNWRGEASAGTWLTQVAYRVILDHARTRRRWWRFWAAGDVEPGGPPADPSAEVADRDEQEHRQQRLDQVLKALSPEDRGLVYLYYFEDQSLAEIATILDVSRDVVKTRLARARAKLKVALGDGDDLF